MSNANALAKTVGENKTWLTSELLQSQLGEVMHKQMDIKRFMRSLLTQAQRNPKILQCTKNSLFSAFVSSAQLGLEIDGRNAHLVPFKSNGIMQATLVPDYKGLVDLAYRSNTISYIHADIVCENDIFEWNRGKLETHKIDFKGNRGAMYAAYALVVHKDGTEKVEVMTKAEIDKVRASSKAKDSGPWVDWYEEMAKKTVFKRVSKWIRLSPEDRALIDEVESAEFDNMQRVGPQMQSPNKPGGRSASIFDGIDVPEPEPEPDPEPKKEMKPAQKVDKPADQKSKSVSGEDAPQPETQKKPENTEKPTEPEQPPMTKPKAIAVIVETLKEKGKDRAKLLTWAIERKLCPEAAEDIDVIPLPKLRLVADSIEDICEEL